ncbi:MAG: hypothetical protein C5B58_04765 [Acidobacteria bacterium]|nr:MAG: hypothetical protein C5B58_04765 [Acidobacteriota bacterium]
MVDPEIFLLQDSRTDQSGLSSKIFRIRCPRLSPISVIRHFVPLSPSKVEERNRSVAQRNPTARTIARRGLVRRH